MAYYIFLKSLRSLEEFRKNSHVKIPPKSPSTNFQNLDKFKNPILIRKFIFSYFSARPTPRPTWPQAQPAHWLRHSPQAKSARPARPVRASVASSREIRFPLRFTPSRVGRLPLVSLTTGLRLSASSPTSSRPSSPAPPPIPDHRAPLRSAPRVPSDHYHLAFISPPLISLLNLSSSQPSSMSLKTLTPALTTPATSPRRSPDPYKSRATSPSFTAPFPALISLSPSSNLPLTEHRHHRAFPVVARPPCRHLSSGEARAELPVLPSPFCAPAGDLRRTGVAGGQAPVSVPPCPLSTPASVHGGPSAPGRSTETWTRSMNYPLGNNSLFRIFQKSCKEVPRLLGNQPAVQILLILHSGPQVFPKLTRGSGFLQFSLKFKKYL
jgi:hypothetical protein